MTSCCHMNCCMVLAPSKKVQHTFPAHFAKQGTQRPCGVRPQLHVGHTGDTGAGPEGRQCGGPEPLADCGHPSGSATGHACNKH